MKWIFGLILGASLVGCSEEPKKADLSKERIYNKLVDSVVRITTEEENRGGTGFIVSVPSGRQMVVTNAHVCEVFGALTESPKAVFDSGKRIKLQIVEIYTENDLCLLKSEALLEGGLTVSSRGKPRMGEQLWAVGHPFLFPLVITDGTYVGTETIGISWIKDCPIESPDHGEHIAPCVKKVNMERTTIVGAPGSSGSPVLDASGEVVGVLFSGNNATYWINYVPLSDLRDLLKNY